MRCSDNIDLNNIEVLEIDENYKKRRINFNLKIFLIILILLLIALFGIGLYWFLTYAKNNVNQVILEDKVIELGEEVNSDINYYLKNNGNCKLDISNVDSSKVGNYKYYIQCENKKYSANIIVKDTVSPKIALQVVNINPGNTFNAEQFIMSSYDLSKINFSFADNINITNYNTKNGLYLIPIKAIDEYQNETIDTGILLVSNVKAVKYLSASKIETTNYDATLKVIDKIGFNTANYYINAIRIYEYTFNSKIEYDNVKEEYDNKKTINDISGQAIFDDNNKSIKLVKTLTKEELNILNGSFPFTYEEIKELYFTLNYTIQVEITK